MNFKQLPNGMSEGFALLKKCDVKKTKNGAAYLDLILGDKSDELPAKLWDYTDNGLFAPDMVVKVRGTVEQYNGRDQFRISQIRPAADSDNYNLSDLVPASEVGGAQIYDMLMRRVNAFQDADFKAIVSGIMEDHKEALVRYPAALRLHHAIVGGLMLHTVSIVRLAESLCQIYPNVDKELLLSGAILHDVAKTWELEANNLGLVKGYTTEGELIGHLVKGAMYIDEKARDLGVAPEKAALLEHMLLSTTVSRSTAPLCGPCSWRRRFSLSWTHWTPQFLKFTLPPPRWSRANLPTGSGRWTIASCLTTAAPLPSTRLT